MKKRILVLATILALVAVLVVPTAALALDSGTVSVSGDSTVIAVTVSPSTWPISGGILQGSTNITWATAVLGYFTVPNTGNCIEDFTIKGTNAVGSTPAAATWILTTTAASDNYTMGWGQATGTPPNTVVPSSYTALGTGYSALTTELAKNGTFLFDLQLVAPNTIPTGATNMAATVTILAVVS